MFRFHISDSCIPFYKISGSFLAKKVYTQVPICPQLPLRRNVNQQGKELRELVCFHKASAC